MMFVCCRRGWLHNRLLCYFPKGWTSPTHKFVCESRENGAQKSSSISCLLMYVFAIVWAACSTTFPLSRAFSCFGWDSGGWFSRDVSHTQWGYVRPQTRKKINKMGQKHWGKIRFSVGKSGCATFDTRWNFVHYIILYLSRDLPKSMEYR